MEMKIHSFDVKNRDRQWDWIKRGKITIPDLNDNKWFTEDEIEN